jgi:hypothetical protein
MKLYEGAARNYLGPFRVHVWVKAGLRGTSTSVYRTRPSNGGREQRKQDQIQNNLNLL